MTAEEIRGLEGLALRRAVAEALGCSTQGTSGHVYTCHPHPHYGHHVPEWEQSVDAALELFPTGYIMIQREGNRQDGTTPDAWTWYTQWHDGPPRFAQFQGAADGESHASLATALCRAWLLSKQP